MSKAQTRASNKYNAKAYDRLAIQVKKGKKSEIQAAAEKQGESLNAYVIGAVERRMEAEGRSELSAKPTSETEETAE